MWVLPLQLDIHKGIAMFRLYCSAAFFLALLITLSAWAEDPAHVDQLLNTRSCADCDLAGAVLDGEDLSTAVLTNANLYGTSLIATNLTGAALSGTNLGLAQLEGAILSGADLTGADLSRANLNAADLNGAILTDAITDEGTICPDASSGPCTF